jgi:hypothetical protein
MCLALYQPAGKQVPESYLRTAFDNNPDGAGFMYFDDSGELVIEKNMGYPEFIDEYETAWALYGKNSPFAVHFRWATHGTKSIENVHPFRVNKHTAFIHNGVLGCVLEDNIKSDTAVFAEKYLAALPDQWFDNKYLFDMVEQYATGSKLVVMTNDPKAEYCAYILNESSGKWDDGVWYSNTSYCAARPVVSTYKSASASAKVFEDEDAAYDTYKLEECILCGEDAVLDGMCYNCDSCMTCYMEDEHCVCKGASQLKFHSMTDYQATKYLGY